MPRKTKKAATSIATTAAAPAGMAPGGRTAVAAVLFLFSGLCSLVYEVVWSRMLVLVLGNTTLATGTILAAFMLGLSLGSLLGGRLADRAASGLLRIFAFLEAATGLYALAFPLLLDLLSPLEQAMAGRTPGAQIFLRLIFCLVLLAPPTLCMGGTFAVLVRWVSADASGFGRRTALLYGINTTGAVLGAGLAGFLLVRMLGHTGSLILLAILNFAIAGTALALNRRLPTPPLPPAIHAPRRSHRKAGGAAESLAGISRFLLICAVFLTGFCSLAWQVLWTRLMILVADNSVYAFSAILMLFLAGSALGSLLLVPLSRRLARPDLALGLLLVAAAIGGLIVPLRIGLRHLDPATTYPFLLLFKLPLLVLLPTALTGAALPLAAAWWHAARARIGDTLGRIWALNTLGGACGALAVPFVLIERLGFYRTSLLLPGLLLACGTLLSASRLRRVPGTVLLLLGVILALAGHRVLPPDHFRNTFAGLEPRSRLIDYHEGRSATTSVFERPDGSRVLYVNGMPEVDTSPASLVTLKMLGALPGLLHPRAESTLMITFGAGVSAGTSALLSDRVECVDLIDRLPEIAAHFAPWNGGILHQRPLATFSDDARHFLRRSRRQYPVIISDATHPRSYDSWVLFTREFYQLVRQRLAADGLFCQWVPFHGISPMQFRAVVRTFLSVFPNTSLWHMGDAYLLLLATPEPLRIDFPAFSRRLQQRPLRDDLRPLGLDNPFFFLSHFAADSAGAARLAAGEERLLSDNSPAQLFFPLSADLDEQYRRWPEENRLAVRAQQRSILPLLSGLENDPRLADRMRYYEALR